MIKETGLLGCKPDKTLIDSNLKFTTKEDGIPVDKGRRKDLLED